MIAGCYTKGPSDESKDTGRQTYWPHLCHHVTHTTNITTYRTKDCILVKVNLITLPHYILTSCFDKSFIVNVTVNFTGTSCIIITNSTRIYDFSVS